MKVYLATDHAGFDLKEKIKDFLKTHSYEVEDCGALEFDKNDDYPDFISKAAQKVSQDPENSRGVIFGGSGQAEMMVANKYPNVRAALFYTPVVPVGAADAAGRTSDDPYEMIRLTREHNNANVLSLGARFLTEEQVIKAVKLWLDAPFPGDQRHARRIDKISEIEKALKTQS
jgi:ribose 5-phosphate isomerase B